MLALIDVTEYEDLIRQEGKRRFENNQRTRIEGMTNIARARMQHTLGVAGEVAARLFWNIDPFDVAKDKIGAPDAIIDGIKWDVKVVRADRRILNVQFYEGVLEHKKDWKMQVMIYEGLGWRFVIDRIIPYKDLKYRPLAEATGGHRSQRWSIDLNRTDVSNGFK